MFDKQNNDKDRSHVIDAICVQELLHINAQVIRDAKIVMFMLCGRGVNINVLTHTEPALLSEPQMTCAGSTCCYLRCSTDCSKSSRLLHTAQSGTCGFER